MSNNTCSVTQRLSEITIKYQRKVKYSDMHKISCSQDALEVIREIWSDNMDHVEEFVVLCLNRANKVLGWSKISTGGTSGCIADPKVIFQIAIKSNSSSIIVAHNHPSGNINQSNSDKEITKKLKSSGSFLDIPVLDHIIIISESFFSFADEGLM